MGYYIDFVFEEAVKEYQEVVKKFCDVGVKIFDPHDPDRPRDERTVELYHPDLPGLIDVYKKKAKHLKGNWAHMRISWDTTPNEVQEGLKGILELAQKVGCRVYDPQHRRYITFDDLKAATEGFKRDKFDLERRPIYTNLVKEFLIELKGEDWIGLWNGIGELVEKGFINEFRAEKLN